jgi:D-alanyl-D-alanine carboxypeptidase (penicillin-binding protein 5/6)
MKRLKAKKYYLLASLLIIAVTLIIYPRIDDLVLLPQRQVNTNEVYLRPIDKIPVLREKIPSGYDKTVLGKQDYVSLEEFSNTITAKSAYVEDIDTGTVLFERNSERILLPASTTKLMMALVSLEEYQLDQVLTVPKLPKIDGFNNEFFMGEQITVQELLKAALIQSNNDAAYIIAMSSSEGLDNFVDRMNQKAAYLNLSSTHYENPAGFDDELQRSSARDLVILSKVFMQNDFLASVVSTPEAVIRDQSGEYSYYLKSTHQLLGTDPTVVGIKTGTTQGAAQVLITQFNRDGHNVIVVVMGSDDRYLETTRIIDWVFNAYLWINPEELIY